MKKKKKIYATSVITDIRNFTGTFENFQNNNSDDFLHLLEDYYQIQHDISKIISKNMYINNTGDGVLTIFKSKNNHLDGYAYALSIYRCLNKLFKEFSIKYNNNISFGIGADSGYVWDVGRNMDFLDTYVGSVINRSCRIEGNTKLFAGTKAAIGNYLYMKLLNSTNKKVYDFVNDFEGEYDDLLNDHKDMVLASENLMLHYIFEMVLKNLNKPLPLFRVSENLVNKDNIYYSVLSKLVSKRKYNELKKYIEDYER